MREDCVIAGRGSLGAGEYGSIVIRGCGILSGDVACESLSASGKLEGMALHCEGTVRTSGRTVLSGDVTAGELCASGTFLCDGSVAAAGEVSLRGFSQVARDLTADGVRMRGRLYCGGVLKGERVELLSRSPLMRLWRFLLCILSLGKARGGCALVGAAIEGGEVSLTDTVCPRVTGRRVAVGRGCRIDLLQYSEEVRISRGATVQKVEKLV